MNVELVLQRFRETWTGFHREECKNGHAKTQENTFIRSDNGARDCRVCLATRGAERRAKREVQLLKKLYYQVANPWPVRCVDCRSAQRFENQAALDAHLEICESYQRASQGHAHDG